MNTGAVVLVAQPAVGVCAIAALAAVLRRVERPVAVLKAAVARPRAGAPPAPGVPLAVDGAGRVRTSDVQRTRARAGDRQTTSAMIAQYDSSEHVRARARVCVCVRA